MKLLIVKISSLGDVVHAFAFANRLKTQKPDITIDWLASEVYAEFVSSNRHVRKVFRFKRSEWGKKICHPATWGEVVSLQSALRKEKYDICLDMQGLLRSGLVTFFSGAQKRVGFSTAREGSRFCYDTLINSAQKPHAVDKLLEALSVFNVPLPEKPSCEFDIPQKASDNVKKLLTKLGVADRYIVFHQGARWPTKNWPETKWRQLSENFYKRIGVPIVFTGSKDDADSIDSIIPKGGRFYNLAGRVGLLELSALLKNAMLMVTVDSGPMHISAAFATPLVAIFGPTSPIKTGPKTAGMAEVVTAGVDCAPCFKRNCPRSMECMEKITPAQVEAIAKKLLRQLGVVSPAK